MTLKVGSIEGPNVAEIVVYVVTPRDAPIKSRNAKNEEITSYECVVVMPDGTMSDVQSTSRVLDSVDRRTEYLITVSEVPDPREAPPRDDSPYSSSRYDAEHTSRLPLVKIVNKAEQYKKEKEAKKKRKEQSASKVRKTIEMNWAIEKGDEGHRMETLRKFLAKGNKVDVVLAKKRKGKEATTEAANALVQRIRKVIQTEGKGWKEGKPAEGKIGGTFTLYAEGKAEKSAQSDQPEDGEDGENSEKSVTPEK
ncbi:putative Translation initiation factor IF-3, chloroplastic [Glarea lozoyensis 74030]|uniref:Putative Translation initiation factor IF-3, chloroplastic n=1 Tax=Glarea lozoyensis (strain ATCC 74030 / MF5533) TaxID=1104152 RepID=H0ELX2_GLAL7|nr:putative Translation initiation factor IF-3, chloroplastic [Glarea lozoyensis 74030]